MKTNSAISLEVQILRDQLMLVLSSYYAYTLPILTIRTEENKLSNYHTIRQLLHLQMMQILLGENHISFSLNSY